jgi:hypothetical protein
MNRHQNAIKRMQTWKTPLQEEAEATPFHRPDPR